MSMGIHHFLMGQPHRIRWLDEAIKYMKGFDDVWFATSGESARWYYDEHLGIQLP